MVESKKVTRLGRRDLDDVVEEDMGPVEWCRFLKGDCLCCPYRGDCPILADMGEYDYEDEDCIISEVE